MQVSATTAAAISTEPHALSRKSVPKRLGRVIVAGVFLALAGALVPVAAIYSFIWLAKF